MKINSSAFQSVRGMSSTEPPAADEIFEIQRIDCFFLEK